MRIAKACAQCRESKRRCSPLSTGSQCNQCSRRGQECSFATTNNSTPPISRHIAPGLHSDTVPIDLALDLVNLYLEFLHGKPHTLYHPDELRRAARDGRIVSHVLFSIAGLASRFSPSEDVRDKKRQYMEMARRDLKSNIDDICLDTLRACLLIGNLYGAEGDSDIESLFFGLAFRIAHIIRLPEASPGDDDIAREEKIRVWWSLYMIDRWSSAGLDVPRQIPDEGFIPLPMHELDFYALSRDDVISHLPRRIGLWAQMVRLVRTFGRIQDLHRQHAAGRIDSHQIQTRTDELSNDLERYYQELPPEHHLKESNIRQHAGQGLGRDFIALHLGLHHYSTLLYFPYLDLQLEANKMQRTYAKRCKDSAAALSDLLAFADKIEGCKPVYFIVAHMTTVSSSALLHDLLFGEESTLSVTKQRLEANFRALIELRNLWPAGVISTHRLSTFQNMCLASADPNTHKADRWMVKYLLQHAAPIDQRDTMAMVTPEFASYPVDRNRYANDALALLRTT